MNFSIKLKLFFIMYGLALVLIIQFIVLKIDEISIKSVSIIKASQIFENRKQMLDDYLQDTKLKVLAVLF